jgi:hypothetical protein
MCSLLRRRTSSSAYMPRTSSQYTAPLTAPLAPVPPPPPPPPGDVGVEGSGVLGSFPCNRAREGGQGTAAVSAAHLYMYIYVWVCGCVGVGVCVYIYHYAEY